MRDFKSFKNHVNQYNFEDIVRNNFSKLLNSDNVYDCIKEESFVQESDQVALFEYINANKDRLLSMQKYTEGQAVVTSNDYAPHSGKNGKVISIGDKLGTYKIKFDDSDDEDIVPEDKLTMIQSEPIQRDSSKVGVNLTEAGEYDVLFFDGKKSKIYLSEATTEADVYEQLDESVVVLPDIVTQYFLKNVSEEMTSDQQNKRESIVLGMKKNSEYLKKKYGKNWESVMYAIATKKALNESYLAESRESLVAKKNSFSGGQITLNMVNDNYIFRRKNLHGEVIDEQSFDNYNDAENAFTTKI